MTWEEFKEQAKHGDKYECEINEIICNGKISIGSDYIYLCQNNQEGRDTDNKLGYKYSWAVENCNWYRISNFRFIEKPSLEYCASEDFYGASLFNSLYDTLTKTKQNTMNISTIAKRIFDKDTKTLIKANFLKDDLSLTEHGEEALYGLLFSDKKDELVKLAQEELDEKKEECCK